MKTNKKKVAERYRNWKLKIKMTQDFSSSRKWDEVLKPSCQVPLLSLRRQVSAEPLEALRRCSDGERHGVQARRVLGRSTLWSRSAVDLSWAFSDMAKKGPRGTPRRPLPASGEAADVPLAFLRPFLETEIRWQ